MKIANLESDPRYAAARRKLNDIRAQLSQAEARFYNLQSSDPKLQQSVSPVTQRAEAMLRGENWTVAKTEWREQLSATLDEIGVLREAIRIQEIELARVQATVSREIATAAVPEYQAIIKRMAVALRAAAEACEEERHFREALQDQGVQLTTAISPVPFNRIGSPADENSHLSAWLAEAAENGYLRRSEAK